MYPSRHIRIFTLLIILSVLDLTEPTLNDLFLGTYCRNVYCRGSYSNFSDVLAHFCKSKVTTKRRQFSTEMVDDDATNRASFETYLCLKQPVSLTQPGSTRRQKVPSGSNPKRKNLTGLAWTRTSAFQVNPDYKA